MRILLLSTLTALLLSSCVHMAADIATNRYVRAGTAGESPKTPTVAQQNADWCKRNDCIQPPLAPVRVLIDVHAHMFMKPGLGWLFSGRPEELEHTPVWSDPLSEKMAVERMRVAGFGIVVVSLYANPLFIWPTNSVPEAIYEEIRQTHDLIARYPDLFTLATTSEQARRAIRSGKIVLVLHLEGSEWAMRSEAELAALYRAGVRFANPIHLYDSWIGGSDLQAGIRFVINPPGWGHSKRVEGRRENRMGLTREGRKLLRNFREYGIGVDTSHFSRQALRDIDAMPEFKGVPLINSHMPDLAWTTASERGVNAETLGILRAHHGLLGQVPTASSPQLMDRYPGLCKSSVETFAAMYADMVTMAAGMPIAFASDFNGGIGHTRPTHGPDGCYPAEEATTEFQQKGLADAGYVPAMLEAMTRRGTSVEPMYEASERFLQIWEQVEQHKTR